MALPAEIALRQVTGHDLWDSGVGVDGIITFTAVPRQLIARTSKDIIWTRPVSVAVTAGAFTVTDGLIAWDGATTDAGQGVPPTQAWAYLVSLSWDIRNPFYIVVPKGILGTIADTPLDIADCVVPQMPGGVAIMVGPPGPGNATDADVAVIATGPGATKTAIDANINGKVSTQHTADNSTYGPTTDSNGEGIARLPGARRNALTGWFHISGYGGDPTGATSSQTAVAACFAAAAAYTGGTIDSVVAAGPTIYVDGQYLLTAPLVPPNKCSFVGNGRDLSELYNNTTDLFAWTTGTALSQLSFRDMGLSTGPSGRHIVNVYGDGTAQLVASAFLRCNFRAHNPAASFVKWRDPSSGANSANFLNNTFAECDFDAAAARTVPAFDFLVSQGNVVNSNVWKTSWCRGHNSTAAPFIRIECNSGGYLYHNKFLDLVGEQNGGGFIHLYACAGFVVQNCPDWDLTAAYTDDVYKFVQSSGHTAYCTGVIENSYRLSNAGGLGSGIYDINAAGNNNTTTTNDRVRIRNCNPPGAVLAANINGSNSVEGLTRAYRLITGTYTIVDTDPDLIVCSSASAFNVTLPAATAAKNGRTVTIKNVGSGVVTIPTTVDGAASGTLAQWAKITCVTDGINAALGRIWFSI